MLIVDGLFDLVAAVRLVARNSRGYRLRSALVSKIYDNNDLKEKEKREKKGKKRLDLRRYARNGKSARTDPLEISARWFL